MSAKARLTTVFGSVEYVKEFDLNEHCIEPWGRQVRVTDHLIHRLKYEVPINTTIIEFIWDEKEEEEENGIDESRDHKS